MCQENPVSLSPRPSTHLASPVYHNQSSPNLSHLSYPYLLMRHLHLRYLLSRRIRTRPPTFGLCIAMKRRYFVCSLVAWLKRCVDSVLVFCLLFVFFGFVNWGDLKLFDSDNRTIIKTEEKWTRPSIDQLWICPVSRVPLMASWQGEFRLTLFFILLMIMIR